MGLFLILFVCFLAQCVFNLADEHLLVILIFSFLLLVFGTFVTFLNSALHQRQVFFSKLVIKNRLLNLFFIQELDKAFSEFELVVHLAFSTNIELFDSLPLIISETVDHFSLFESQLKIVEFLEASTNYIENDVSDTKSTLVDVSIDELLQD